MKLIREVFEDLEYITEGEEGQPKNLYIKGVFLQSAIKNRNGRLYPEEIMDKEVGRYITESVKTKSSYGELGHPATPQIGLDRVSHIITELTKEGTNWIGKARITSTPMGDVARGLIESGGRLGVSSRGMGTVKPNRSGINEVQSDFRLATAADIVADPSAPDAYVNGIMENVEWFYNDKHGWEMINIAEAAKAEINMAVRNKRLEEAKLGFLENYLRRISEI